MQPNVHKCNLNCLLHFLKGSHTLTEHPVHLLFYPSTVRLNRTFFLSSLFQEDNSADVEKALKEWNNEVENMLLTLVSSFNQELRDTYFSTTVEQVNLYNVN